MIHALGSLILMSVLAATAAPARGAADHPVAVPEPLEQGRTVAHGVVLTGTLEAQALAQLDASRTRLIDLRTAEEGTAAQAALARQQGIDYHNIPVAGASIGDTQVEALSQLLQQPSPGIVVIQCASGNRAGMLWGAVQLQRGVPLDAVLEAVSGAVTKAPIRKALTDYADRLSAAPAVAPAVAPASAGQRD